MAKIVSLFFEHDSALFSFCLSLFFFLFCFSECKETKFWYSLLSTLSPKKKKRPRISSTPWLTTRTSRFEPFGSLVCVFLRFLLQILVVVLILFVYLSREKLQLLMSWVIFTPWAFPNVIMSSCCLVSRQRVIPPFFYSRQRESNSLLHCNSRLARDDAWAAPNRDPLGDEGLQR